MAVDPKQILSAFLTLTMFGLIVNMIKRDHFDPVEKVILPGTSGDQFDRVADQSHVSLAKVGNGPWKEDSPELKPCWSKPEPKDERSKGFITFSLTNGPEYHISQIVDAVVVARYLGATLVLPDIRGTKLGEKRFNPMHFFYAEPFFMNGDVDKKNMRPLITLKASCYMEDSWANFQEIYDVEKFVKSLDGVIEISKDQPAQISKGKLAVVKVPNWVTEDFIEEQIEPIFRTTGTLRLVTYFPSVNMKKTEEKKDSDSIACLAMFHTLKLQPEVHEVVDSMVGRLRTLSRKSDGQFIAVDLRVEMLESKGCQGSGKKSCYNAQEIGEFLRKIGFSRGTTIYLTQSWWHSSFDALKEIFPNVYTKENIMPAEKKYKFLNSGSLESAIDFYICSQSDVFVPAISGLFYANVAGKRITSGKTQILIPAQVSNSSASASDFISSYVSKRNHFVYSCFC